MMDRASVPPTTRPQRAVCHLGYQPSLPKTLAPIPVQVADCGLAYRGGVAPGRHQYKIESSRAGKIEQAESG